MKLPIERMTRMLWAWLVIALLAASSGVRAQQVEAAPFKPEELEALVAPIALYPDSVLSQALMASTYPLEVVQAARWLKANPTLKGEAAVKAVANQSWDVSARAVSTISPHWCRATSTDAGAPRRVGNQNTAPWVRTPKILFSTTS